jgi:hypothetical protein
VLWIRIGSGFNGVPGSVSGSGFAIEIRFPIEEGAKMAQKNGKQLINFFEVLDVLF